MRATARAFAGGPRVRAARDDDVQVVAALLYESSPELFELYAGSRDRALALLRAAISRPGNTASLEVASIAEVDGRAAAAMTSFPVSEASRRGAALMRLSFRTIPPWRWRGMLRVYRHGVRSVPPPPPRSYYVDSLASFSDMRRRGAATALLGAAEDRARAHGLESLALETELENSGAQALYERFGFEESDRSAPAGGLPGFVAYVKRL